MVKVCKMILMNYKTVEIQIFFRDLKTINTIRNIIQMYRDCYVASLKKHIIN